MSDERVSRYEAHGTFVRSDVRDEIARLEAQTREAQAEAARIRAETARIRAETAQTQVDGVNAYFDAKEPEHEEEDDGYSDSASTKAKLDAMLRSYVRGRGRRRDGSAAEITEAALDAVAKQAEALGIRNAKELLRGGVARPEINPRPTARNSEQPRIAPEPTESDERAEEYIGEGSVGDSISAARDAMVERKKNAWAVKKLARDAGRLARRAGLAQRFGIE